MKRSLWTFGVAAAFGTMLVQAPVALAHVELEATLDADQEVPDPDVGTHNPTGTATFTFDFATGLIDYAVTVNDPTGPVTAAHIHTGVEGVAGGVLVPLDNSLNGTTSVALTEPQITALFSEGLYVNVHTADNMAGEIRGQITLVDGQCECDGTRKDFTKCVKQAIKALSKEDKKSAAVKALKKAVKRSFCGKRKAGKHAIGCCLPAAPVENIVTGRICAAVPATKCTKFGGTPEGAETVCEEGFCSPSGAFLNDSNLF
jgi:hypothetical protein